MSQFVDRMMRAAKLDMLLPSIQALKESYEASKRRPSRG